MLPQPRPKFLMSSPRSSCRWSRPAP